MTQKVETFDTTTGQLPYDASNSDPIVVAEAAPAPYTALRQPVVVDSGDEITVLESPLAGLKFILTVDEAFEGILQLPSGLTATGGETIELTVADILAIAGNHGSISLTLTGVEPTEFPEGNEFAVDVSLPA